jgi:spermidine synthase
MRSRLPEPLTPLRRNFLLFSLFITGGVSLILEIAGTRLISPFYGSSIYSWSALITVTLLSLACGYGLGGRQADKSSSLQLFSRLIAASAVMLALIPLLRSPVLRLTSGLGVRLGALASAAILTAPALVLLSMLGPIAIRLASSDIDTVGRRTGEAYAVSTAGSVMGAILAGFVLIPRLPITQIFYGTAAMLLALSALGHIFCGRDAMKTAAAAGALAIFGFWPRPLPATNVLVNKESAYGQIKVMDTLGGKRYLLVNGTSQSVARLPGLENESQYAHALDLAPLLRPKARRALVIGIGAGLLPSAWERAYGLTVDSVDIDPEVVRVARSHFGFSPRGDVFIEDGRTFLEKPGPSYDLMVLDAYGSESPPYHLFSREAMLAMKRRLQPGGVLAVNMVSILKGQGSEPWLSTYRTLRSVFPQVRAFIGSDTFSGMGNILYFASDDSLDGGDLTRAARPSAPDLKAMLAAELFPAPEALAQARLLTDDYCPMEFLLAQTATIWRAHLQNRIPQILLY